MPERTERKRFVRWLFFGAAALAAVVLLLVLLFIVNGTLLASGETPVLVTTHHEAVNEGNPRQIKVLAYNIAKCFVYKGGGKFVEREEVVARLERMATLINQEEPDLIFLSEAVVECGPANVNQVKYLAEATGMHCWAFGENFNFGLPGYRITSGNAILSRWPLVRDSNPSLAGRQPFYVTKNNRRVLWCRLKLGDEELLLGSIHTDSFNIDNNHRQTQQILEFSKRHPTIIAGDFNANPDESSIVAVRNSNRFVGEFAPPKTFSTDQPEQTLDYIFAPAAWRLIDHRVLPGNASDHFAVVSVFERADEVGP